MKAGCRVQFREACCICKLSDDLLLCWDLKVFTLNLLVSILWIYAQSHPHVRFFCYHERIYPVRGLVDLRQESQIHLPVKLLLQLWPFRNCHPARCMDDSSGAIFEDNRVYPRQSAIPLE